MATLLPSLSHTHTQIHTHARGDAFLRILISKSPYLNNSSLFFFPLFFPFHHGTARSDESKSHGFTIIVDMRGNGNTAASAKMILKVLQENFGTDVIHQAVIIKPDNFWHKQRSSIASNKYKFETTTISIQSLGKLVEPSQLTSDFEGFLHYDHAVWIDLRVAFEDFLWQASDILDRIDDLQEDLTHSECPEDVNGAKHSIDAHNEMKRKILKLPIEDLDLQGQKLLGKLTTYSNRNDDGCHSAPLPTNCINPDVTSAMNQVREESSGFLGDMGKDRVFQISCVLRKEGVPLGKN